MNGKCLVLTSGGIDSTACMSYYLELRYEVQAMFVDYGHPANPVEYDHIRKLCRTYGVPLVKLVFRGANVSDKGEIRGRNAFLIAAALMAAPSFSGIIALGIHSGSPYYDCGPRFLNLAMKMVSDYSDGTVQLDIPFKEMAKPEIVQYCRSQAIPLEQTYSCEAGSLPPCQDCLSCEDRKVLGLQ